MPRLGHKKSRNGCRQCKARHVKCDEVKPCSNCARHGVQCSLVTWDPAAPPPVPIKEESNSARRPSKPLNSIPERPRKSSAQASSTSLPLDYVLNPSPNPTPASSEASSPYSQSDTYPFLTRFANKAGSSQTESWVRDLELIHHWTIQTYKSLAAREDVREFWCMEAPKLAINHPFLLHEILAISALHKAYLHPDQRSVYYPLGIHHQDLAIKEMRTVLPNLNADNAGAMFATGAIVSLTAFASAGLGAHDASNRSSSLIDDLLDIFALQHGMYCILSQNHVHVIGGPFVILLSDSKDKVQEPEQPLLVSIAAQTQNVGAFVEAQQLPPPSRIEVLDALSSLKSCLDFANAPRATTRELRFLFFWPNRLSSTFSNMMRRREPAALVVLAYYAVAFRAAEKFYWYLDGWAERIVRAIVETVAAEPRWQPVLQWPWDCVMGTQHAQNHQISHQGHTGTAERPGG